MHWKEVTETVAIRESTRQAQITP